MSKQRNISIGVGPYLITGLVSIVIGIVLLTQGYSWGWGVMIAGVLFSALLATIVIVVILVCESKKEITHYSFVETYEGERKEEKQDKTEQNESEKICNACGQNSNITFSFSKKKGYSVCICKKCFDEMIKDLSATKVNGESPLSKK